MTKEYTYNECTDKLLKHIAQLGLPIDQVNVNTDIHSSMLSSGMQFTTTVTITMTGNLKKAEE